MKVRFTGNYIIVSFTNDINDGLAFKFEEIIVHSDYDNLFILANKISHLDVLWWENEENRTDEVKIIHDELEIEVRDEWNKLMPSSWDKANNYEDSFWEVIGMAFGYIEV